MSRPVINIIRLCLTAAFLYFGLRKLTGGTADVAIYDAIGQGQWPRPITGTVETVAALALWIPGVQGWAALLLIATMIIGSLALIIFTSLPFLHLPLLGILAAMIAWHWREQITAPIDRLRGKG